MNKEIKKIVDDYRKLDHVCIDTLNQFAIEICELQKIECAKQTDLLSGFMSHIDNAKEIINLTKNIAENDTQ